MFGSSGTRKTAGLALFLALIAALGWMEFQRRAHPERVIEVAVVPFVPASPGASTPSEKAPDAVSGSAAPAAATPAVPPPPSEAGDAPSQTAAPKPDTGLAPSAAAPLATTAPEAQGPRFDIVRVDPTGAIVAAGRSAPGASVELLAKGKLIDKAFADAAGQWVIVPGLNLPPGPHQLTLRATGAGGTTEESAQVVDVIVPAQIVGKSSVVVNEPGKQPAGEGTEIAMAPAPPGQGLELRPADGSTSMPATLTPAPSTAGGSGSGETQQATVQPPAIPAPPAPVMPGPVPAGAISVDQLGAEGPSLTMRGHGPAGASLRILFNGTVVAEPVIAPDGTWSLTVERGIVSGEYQIRIEQIEKDGKVVARVERLLEHTAPPVIARASPPAEANSPSAQPASTPEQTSGQSPPGPTLTPGVVAPAATDAGTVAAAPSAGTPASDLPATAEAGPPAPGDEADAKSMWAPNVAPGSSTADAAAPPASGQAAAGDGSHVVIGDLDTVSVRRGDSLWVISRRAYGKGVLYGVIYRANRDRIRRPRLIFPGQVLVMPPKQAS